MTTSEIINSINRRHSDVFDATNEVFESNQESVEAR